MFSATAFYASLWFSVAVGMPGAVPEIGPMATPMNLMAIGGISPRPTEAPGSNSIPQELRRRGVQYPPPDNWCGFVEGAYDNPLTCPSSMTCLNSNAAFGCCSATTGICTDLWTTCANFFDSCDDKCQLNPAILKCTSDKELPFCGTYSFHDAGTLFNCEPTTALPYSVEFLNDHYVTAIGSTLAPDPTAEPFGYTVSVTVPSDAAYGTSGSDTAHTASYHQSTSGGLSKGAIGGVATAATIVGMTILALIAFYFVRQRKRKRFDKPAALESMQQQQQQREPPKPLSGYQILLPQQQNTQNPCPPQQQTLNGGPLSAGMPSASANSSTQTAVNNSVLQVGTGDTTLLSPVSEPNSDQHQDHRHSPFRPTLTEVDGTMGNPGIPANEQYSRPSEVDGTIKSSGVPAGGLGNTGQMQTRGSTSAAEIDGRTAVRGSETGQGDALPGIHPITGEVRDRANQPSTQEPHEMGQGSGRQGA